MRKKSGGAGLGACGRKKDRGEMREHAYGGYVRQGDCARRGKGVSSTMSDLDLEALRPLALEGVSTHKTKYVTVQTLCHLLSDVATFGRDDAPIHGDGKRQILGSNSLGHT